MKKNEFSELVDRDLSGLVWDERQSRQVLHALDEEERPMKKKLSTGMVIVLALLVLGMAAAVAGGFGILHFREEQSDNAAFVQSIFSLGQTYEDDSLTIRLNDAVFDGTRLALTMDILPKPGGQQVFVYPRITAECAGQTLTAMVEECVGQFPDGFWVPNVSGIEDVSPEHQYVVVALMGEDGSEIAPAVAEGDVAWSLTFDVYRPNWPVDVTDQQRPSELAGVPAYDADASAMDAAYDALFAEAYRQQRILVYGGCPGIALADYGHSIPTSTANDISDVEHALQSEAFTHQGQAVFAFTARAEGRTSPQVGQVFPLTEGWQAELMALNVSMDRIDCTLKLTRSAADGRTALQACMDGEPPWDFALLPEGVTAANPLTNGDWCEDGALLWIGSVEITAPISQVTLVPCHAADTLPFLGDVAVAAPAPEDTAAAIYAHGGAVTDAQRALTITVTVE